MEVAEFVEGPWRRAPTGAEEREEDREDIVRFREGFRLPVSAAIVEQLLALPEKDRDHELGRWLLPDERALFARREREVFRHARIVQRYLDAEAADDHAQLRLEHVGDGEIHVRFAHNLERHATALRRVFPKPEALRFLPAARSARELHTLQERVDDELFEDPPPGFEQSASWCDYEHGVVRISAICADPDAARRLISKRYGEAVALEVIATEPERLEPVPWTSYTLEGRELTVYWFTNAAYRHEDTSIEESLDRVVVTVREWIPNSAAISLAAAYRQSTLPLRSELDKRRVIDGADGEDRPRYPGPVPPAG